ncbi:S-adenosyl-L-methionine-dependent methyltransferase [Longispora fulva]|nr:S-adenosyl-L-methionine-dependent methyltransferase [Longispora fulva]
MEAVSLTAQWTAAARALESERPDALFVDDCARTVAGDTGFTLLERYSGSGIVPFIAVRTKYMDDAIVAATAGDGPRQVVLVAAGMDTRVRRLPWPAGVTVYELDRPALLAAKNDLLATTTPRPGPERVPVPVDLAGEWTPALVAAGFDQAAPTLWVVEGLFFFLPEEAVTRLLGTLRGLSAAGSVLVADMASRASLTNPFARQFLGALEEDGAPWLFGTDEPEPFLKGTGWAVSDLKQPGEEGAAYGRWPYPAPPRELANAPRSFLFTAQTG